MSSINGCLNALHARITLRKLSCSIINHATDTALQIYSPASIFLIRTKLNIYDIMIDESKLSDNFDAAKLRKSLVNIEKKYNDNQKLRIKHADCPVKFAESETELYAALDEIQSIATQPELYPVLVSRNGVELLCSLITHENTDISSKVVDILHDLTDIDTDAPTDASTTLMDELIKKNIVGIITTNFSRFDRSKKDESQAIIDSLGIISNLIEFNSNVPIVAEGLITWMVDTLKSVFEYDAIKLPIAELMAILVVDQQNKMTLNEVGGVDALLQQVAFYRRVAPKTGDEHEFLEQVINCLCTAILNCDANRKAFFEEEGVDLIELILREKGEAVRKSNLKLSSLKLFNHVLTTDQTHDEIVTSCCEKFIEILGLRVIFPLFKNPKIALNEKIKKREYHQFLDEVEEHTSAIILSILKNSKNSEHIQRVLVKFAESKFDKMQRLFKLHDKYFMIVQNSTQEEEDETKTSGSAFFTLMTIDYTILLVSFLTSQYETYDPTSGEIFDNFILNTLSDKPQLRHQVIMSARKHIDLVVDTTEERESLNMLLEHFVKLGKLKKSSD